MPREWYLMGTNTYFSGDELNNFDNYAREGFDELLSMSPEAETVLINGNEKRVIIQNTMTENIRLISLRYMLSHIGDSKEGYYVDFRGHKWLVLAVPDNNKMYEKSVIQRCNHNLKWINNNNQLITKPCIEDARTLYTTGVRDEKVIEIPNGMVGIQLPYDEDTRLLDRGHAFIFNKTKYVVTFYDDTTYPGLVVLICSEKLEHSPTDDMVNGIANRYIEMPDGTLADRLGEQPPKPNPTEPENPDETPEGITYSYTALMPYPEDPDNEIWWNESATYTIHKFIDGVEVDAEFEFTLEQNPSDLAYISNKTSNSVTITSYFGRIGEVVLRAIDIETEKVAIEHKINVVN